MRRTPVLLLAVVAVLLLPVSAVAAPVLVLGHHGRVTRRNDPYITGPAITPAPAQTMPSTAATGPESFALGSHEGGAGVGSTGSTGSGTTTPTNTGSTSSKNTHKHKKKKPPPVTVASVLAGLQRSGQITATENAQALGSFNAALATERRLSGTRRTELAAVTTTVHTLAAEHALWPSRLPAIEATLDANRQWWSTGSLLSYGQRVMFSGSQLEWEYYPGQGIQLQVLGSFGEANGLWQAGQTAQLQQLLSELIPLAANRGGGLTWEYYFDWEGGSPPWTSAMSQATALQALSHAYQATGNAQYLTVAAHALGAFEHTPAHGGVSIPTPRGLRFVQYTFTPGTAIINAFLQALIGLDTYAQVSGNPIAAKLFAEGNAEAEWEVPHYNTGAWSLYQPGQEDDLSYHELVTGFLAKLCTLTAAPVYCSTATDFTDELTTPPVLSDLTPRTRARHPFSLRFRLSKISDVGVTIRRGSTIVFQTSATFPYGVHSVSVPKLGPGADTVTLTATDLAGNHTAEPPAPLTVTR